MDSADNIKAVKDWLGSGSINIFGFPYAGKDTQGHRLAAELDARLVGSGDILRQRHIPAHVKKLHHSGKLFPTDIFLEFVLPYLSQKQLKGRPLVLSSVGRWHGEETPVLAAAAAAGHPIKAVLYLNISEATVWKRWKHS